MTAPITRQNRPESVRTDAQIGKCPIDSSLGCLGIRPITDREFVLFRDLIARESGVALGPSKRALLTARLAGRLRQLGLDSFTAYYGLVHSADRAELTRMIDSICTNETSFFREPDQFEFLRERVLPQWLADARAGRRPSRIRALSAGCATGEEPYSLAMELLECFPKRAGWDVAIQAVDISTRALATARAGVWPIEKAAEVPLHYLKRFMLKGIGNSRGTMKAGSELRSVVRFSQLNLNAPAHPIQGRFDLILCRNTMIYFEPESRLRTVNWLLDLLSPDGLLLLGHAESLHDLTQRVRSVIPTVYRLADRDLDPDPGSSESCQQESRFREVCS